MSLTLSDFRRLLRKGLGNLSTGDLSNAEADELLNLALWDIEDRFPFEFKETVYTTSLVEDQYEYDLSGMSLLDAIVSVSYLDEQGQSNRLDRMSRTEYDEMFNDGSVTSPSAAKIEYYLREGNVLTIWPPPNDTIDGNTIRIALKESIASMANTSDTTRLPRNWDQVVLKGAVELGHFLNQDYNDEAAVANSKIRTERGLITTESKEESDSHHSGLDVLWDAPRS